MSTRTFPQSPTASSPLRPDRRQWTWVIGGVFALLFALGLAISSAQPPEDESSPPVPTGQGEPAAAVLEPGDVPRSTPAAAYEPQAPERISAPEPARSREPAHDEDCTAEADRFDDVGCET